MTAPQAVAAREAARHGDGRFGVQPLAEATDVELADAPAPVTVLDRRGDPVTLTPGVLDGEAKYAYSSGQCLALAIAVSERTGWPVYVRMGHGLVGRRRKPVDYVIHAMVQTPDGLYLDANGVRGQGEWVESGHEIASQLVAAEQARGLLKTHTVGMSHQDVDTAATFVQPVLEQGELA